MAEVDKEGLSRPKKVAAGAAIGVAIPAAVAVAKKLIGDDGESRTSEREKPQQRQRSEPTRRSRPAKPSSRRKPRASTAKSATKTTTRQQLYAQAARLKIGGRSSMSKSQLERAVNRAKQKGKKR
jgi:hypothetical protein